MRTIMIKMDYVHATNQIEIIQIIVNAIKGIKTMEMDFAFAMPKNKIILVDVLT